MKEDLKRIRIYFEPSIYYWVIGMAKAEHKTPSIVINEMLREKMR